MYSNRLLISAQSEPHLHSLRFDLSDGFLVKGSFHICSDSFVIARSIVIHSCLCRNSPDGRSGYHCPRHWQYICISWDPTQLLKSGSNITFRCVRLCYLVTGTSVHFCFKTVFWNENTPRQDWRFYCVSGKSFCSHYTG